MIDRLDTWYARYKDDVQIYGRNKKNVVHLGDWLIDAFPISNNFNPQTLTIGDEILKNLPLDRTTQQIQTFKKVVSPRLHPLLCALTSAEEVMYSEQHDEKGMPCWKV